MISKTTLAATSDMYDTISNEINKLYKDRTNEKERNRTI